MAQAAAMLPGMMRFLLIGVGCRLRAERGAEDEKDRQESPNGIALWSHALRSVYRFFEKKFSDRCVRLSPRPRTTRVALVRPSRVFPREIASASRRGDPHQLFLRPFTAGRRAVRRPRRAGKAFPLCRP